jgi:nucleoside-diphosphate-sugar epimerase
MKNILISGTSSGLGKYLNNTILGSIALNRDCLSEYNEKNYDVIIHCASPSDRQSKKIIYESEKLLNSLLKINHHIFVFISTIDIYRDPNSFYSKSKLNCEKILKNHPHSLILRSSMILGPTMRENHITKIQKNENLTLSGESTFNYIAMKNFKIALTFDKLLTSKGIYDFVSTNNLNIKEVKKILHSSSITGSYNYDTPEVFGNPIYDIFPKLTFSSEQTLKEAMYE